MPTARLQDLTELSDLLLPSSWLRLRIATGSMRPTLRPGDEITVEPITLDALQPGELVLFRSRGQLVCHRLMEVRGTLVRTRGDATTSDGEWIDAADILGRVTAIRPRNAWAGIKDALRSARRLVLQP